MATEKATANPTMAIGKASTALSWKISILGAMGDSYLKDDCVVHLAKESK